MCLNRKHLTYNKQIFTYDVGQYWFYGSSATIINLGFTSVNIVASDP